MTTSTPEPSLRSARPARRERGTTMAAAVALALAQEMRRDPRVVLLGEDVVTHGGTFTATRGLVEEFGPRRVRDTPISETAIVGAALGAALTGLRPVVEIMFADFLAVAYDQVVNQIAKHRYQTGGRAAVPLVIRCANGVGDGFGAQHSQAIEAWLTPNPGLVVATPSTPADAFALTVAAIRSDDPVVLLEPKSLYFTRGELPEGLPPADRELSRRRPGRDVTIVAAGAMVPRALKAADRLAAEGVEADVLDLRWLLPVDREGVAASLSATGALVCVDEAPEGRAWGAELLSWAVERGLVHRGVRVSPPAVPIPYSPPLERAYLPDPERIAAAALALLARSAEREEC